MVEADAAHPVLENSFDASSVGPSTSVLLNTLKELQQNQATLASRLDKQHDTNAEFRTWMQNQEETSKKQVEDTFEIKNLMAALASKFSQSLSVLCLSWFFLVFASVCLHLLYILLF